MGKLPLSVAIISFNEEKNLGRTLEAIKTIASEIIIVDSHSTDKTEEIAKSYNGKFYDEDWKGHVAQKNSALDKCTQDWILALDCDEVCDAQLIEEIREVVEKDDRSKGYKINRKTFYKDKLLEYGWQPDWKFRLFANEKKARWGGYDPHDVLQCELDYINLKGNIIHYSYTDVNDHFQRTIKYAQITAQSYHKMGKKFKISKLIFSPIFSFIKDYIVRKGYKDGIQGFIVGTSAPIYVFLKYAFLWEIQHDERKKK